MQFEQPFRVAGSYRVHRANSAPAFGTGVPDTCPIAWSEDIVETLEEKGKDVTFHRYKGAGHTFEGATWQRSIERTVDFFDEHLD